MISECNVDMIGEVFPVGFVVVDESFSFVGFGVFLGYESSGEDRDMV